MVEAPALLFSCPADETSVAAALESEGWKGGCTVHTEPQDLQGALALTAIAPVLTAADSRDWDVLYAERFARSFFVREEEHWDIAHVLGSPRGTYNLRIAIDEPHSLLTVRAMADPRGKAGAAQIVHAMNVMCGYEESLGIPSALPG
jgi:N-acetyl-gamma-glutamylphosphate reductase